ncbi:class I SAM-dependent methyltransferase [Enterococcus sp. RIT-PI-f]|uniref:class I SAM-dependent methyltransferase n=1 Tax=Enterococcus sp. RIT-PI-f TaxID=1690244 RepID=UPI0006B963EC|nr:class I SAM-dependent methyltransferase [Enterococcus sp. RIT-PI-f]KPG71498.1 adenine methyltransferase [Enterococcus sp. RIT-PI-f]
MSAEKMESSFHLTVEAIQLLQNALESSFFDSYVETIENFIDHYQVRVIDGVPDETTVARLQTIYEELKAVSLTAEEKRKLAQLLLLKGGQTERLQANHQLTPDSLGFLFVYLIEQLTNADDTTQILDLSVGMGNLLLTVLLNLQLAKRQVEGTGVDIDETLLAIAAATSEWTQAPMHLFHQDGLQDLLIEPMDIAISDLPVGYYPQDEKAGQFISAAPEGHSYAHHLLMEQAMNYVKPDGFGIFLIPSNFLETEQSDYLKKWLKEKVYLQGMIQLPDELFKQAHSRKSILLLQNKGEMSQQVSEVLLVKLASLKEPKNITKLFEQFAAWKAANL